MGHDLLDEHIMRNSKSETCIVYSYDGSEMKSWELCGAITDYTWFQEMTSNIGSFHWKKQNTKRSTNYHNGYLADIFERCDPSEFQKYKGQWCDIESFKAQWKTKMRALQQSGYIKKNLFNARKEWNDLKI